MAIYFTRLLCIQPVKNIYHLYIIICIIIALISGNFYCSTAACSIIIISLVASTTYLYTEFFKSFNEVCARAVPDSGYAGIRRFLEIRFR
jgi:TRAP-type C4-dicarboxylate transport system permease large subunit